MYWFGLVSVFLGSLQEQVLHSFIPPLIFLLPTLLPSSLFASYSSFVCFLLPPAMSCYASSLLFDSAMMIVRSLSCASPPFHCTIRLNRHVATSLFFHTPKTSLRLSRCNSKLLCLSTDVPQLSRTIFRHHLISPLPTKAAEAYVVSLVGSL